MYYEMMKTAFKPVLISKISFRNKNYTSLMDKEMDFVDSKSYQKIFVVLISLFIILIFPESPKELENICKIYNSRNLCNVW